MNYATDADIVVIGAGPAGLFTVFAAGMLDMRCHVVDILDKPGGQCSVLYPEKNIYDVPGIPVISGMDLVRNLMTQASRFNPVFHYNQRVLDICRMGDQDIISVRLSSANALTCRAVVIAAGNGAISPRKLGIENASLFENKSLFYRVTNVSPFTGAHIGVVGGGNSAADWAIMLSDIASKISVVHRRDKFSCFPDSENKLRDLAKSGKINLYTKYQVSKLEGNDGLLKRIHLASVENAPGRILPVDYLLVFLGLDTDTGAIANWGVETAKFGRVLVNQRDMSTGMKGVYAVGDVAEYPGKLRLIANGFAEATTACYAIRDLIKDTPLHFEYSTHKLEGVDS